MVLHFLSMSLHFPVGFPFISLLFSLHFRCMTPSFPDISLLHLPSFPFICHSPSFIPFVSPVFSLHVLVLSFVSFSAPLRFHCIPPRFSCPLPVPACICLDFTALDSPCISPSFHPSFPVSPSSIDPWHCPHTFPCILKSLRDPPTPVDSPLLINWGWCHVGLLTPL